ncbi:MAG: site-specific DNA-methyltransferase [Candidatus Cloacimonetes bacterium]|nr:site-specific DNA-methyltransferase [Candidatus Cloacimonadota bacterium]
MPTLTWLGKQEAIKQAATVPYRLLEHDPALSHGEKDTANMLIQGDNLEALKALLPYYAGQVKCIYIDPPYNTRNAFEHYDDNLEHSAWLSLMYPRLELLRELLAEDGSIWISIDDDECHYLKAICDEVFGRRNFVASVVWQKRTSPDNRLRLGDAHDTILTYCKDAQKNKSQFNQLPVSSSRSKDFKNLDNDPRGPWASTDFTGMTGHATDEQYFTITTPGGKKYSPPPGRCWALAELTFQRLLEENRVWFGKSGNARPRLKRFLSELGGINAWTWWTNKEVGHNQEAKKEIIAVFGPESPFDTPKPERLIQRIITLATQPGDLVLDSFLGSGTTAAVAHKMGRRYIGIELGEHAVTHCVPRLQKVIEGEQGGISGEVNWNGGGGFRFYRLGEPVFDETGRIHPQVRFRTLASHIWFAETGTPLPEKADSPLLGIHGESACYLLFNGILGDKSVNGGNVLTRPLLAQLPPHEGPRIIYGEACRLSQKSLKDLNITFRQIPYDVKAR